ncbi:hypothetical protein ACTMU2_21980 [Cupriavidus basilensis]
MKPETELDLADLRAVLAVADTASYTRAAQDRHHAAGDQSPNQRAGAVAQCTSVPPRRGGFVLTEAGSAFCEGDAGARTDGGSAAGDQSGRQQPTRDRGPRSTADDRRNTHSAPRSRIPQRLPGSVRAHRAGGYVNDLFDMLMDKQIDIALLNGPFNPSAVDLEPLYHYHLGIVCPIALDEVQPS